MNDGRSVGLEDVWMALAEHFLDTETRHEIPHSALVCVQAGFAASDVKRIWLYEVSATVGFNSLLVAGEWAAWDRGWLIERIEQVRVSRARRPRAVNWLFDSLRFDPLRGIRLAIEAFVAELSGSINFEERARAARSFGFLARHYFDFAPLDPMALNADEAADVRASYPKFEGLIRTAIAETESAHAAERVEAALARLAN